MSGKVRLILALHNHQPVGNFDGVFEAACADSYFPFLSMMDQFPDIPFALHTSGSLLEWLEEHRPEYVDRVRNMAARSQVEIMGGAYYEPILANIPRRDRIGQIRSYSEHLARLFGTPVQGMWMPERVWEQSFAADLSAAGIRYTILDDYHFRCAGLPADDLHGHYLTEDEGRLVSVFPGNERMRYIIPFGRPEEAIDYLRDVANRFRDAVVVFGDDGEKFGAWPNTRKHVYEDGWLERFLNLLRENEDWLKVTTPSEALDHVAPLGTCYLPDCSYREMTEWVLPPEPQQDLTRLMNTERGDDADWNSIKRFVRGGTWRGFRTRYPESRDMYARMLEVSERVRQAAAAAAELSDADQRTESEELIADALRHLYRAQCNCTYWHGAFGGLYLPHLRNAVYGQLIAADTLLDELDGREDAWIEVATGDFNLDARTEVRLNTHRLQTRLAPAEGGHLYELDVRACGVNLGATLDRRPEAYHATVLRGEHGNGADHLAGVQEEVKFKQPGLDQKICYDSWRRRSLVDHFLRPNVTADEFARGEGRLADFESGAYECSVRRGVTDVAVEMRRTGMVNDLRATVRKTVVMSSNRPGEIQVQYQIHDLPPNLPIHFGVEFNFAAMPGGAPDRYFYGADGSRMGQLNEPLSCEGSDRLSLVDEWLGLDVSLECSQVGNIWTHPVESISQSEGGFELVHQSVCVMPHWQFTMPASGPWVVDLRLVLDSSMASARSLAELGNRHTAAVPAGS